MKSYICHKTVEAAKILQMTRRHGPVTTLMFADSETQEVSSVWVEKNSPQVGGYFVRYKDGYTSYSPAEALEEGYTEA